MIQLFRHKSGATAQGAALVPEHNGKRHNGLGRRHATLMATSGLVGLLALLTSVSLPRQDALADGGSGANGGSGAGSGGTGYVGTAGGDAPDVNAGTYAGGGGGGGAGGGAGGHGGDSGANSGGSGGLGGTSGSPNGGDGGTITINSNTATPGGGGGGGGYNGNGAGAAGISGAGTQTGGNGGRGGDGGATPGGTLGYAGGGGAGGYGGVITGATASTYSGAVQGGAGGAGGNGQSGSAGSGGDGGVGLVFTTSGASLSLQTGASVSGGAGGAKGTGGGGSTGSGGIGITGSGLTIINGGTITGGLGNAGAGARALAIEFTGGTNALEIWAGSTITGNAVGSGTGSTLRLGGATNGTLDTSQIGGIGQYRSFATEAKTGTSTWTLTGTTGATTPWTINQGVLSISADANLGGASGGLTFGGGTLETTSSFSSARGVTLNTAGTIQTDANVATILSGVIADGGGGAGSLTKAGTGTLTLSGTNTYTGTTAISAGTLQGGAAGTFSAASATSIGSGGILDLGGFAQAINAVGLGGGTLRNGTLTGAVTSTGGSISALAGGATVTTTAGTTTLAGTNIYSGTTAINAGTLQGGAAGTFSAASATSIGSGGILDLGGFAQAINAVTLGGGTLRNGTLSGAVTSTGGTISALGGGATVTTTAGTTTLAGTNTYTGATAINGGTLQGGAAATFSAASATSIGSGGILDLGGFAQTINAVTLGGGTLRNGTQSGAVTSTGGTISALGGAATVTTTAGTTTLAGTNTYTGGTAINGGTLTVDGVVTQSPITVNAGGTLSGAGKIGDPTIAAGGTLAPGNAGTPFGTLTIVGPLGFAAGSFYNVAIDAAGQNSRTNVVGATTITGGTVNVAAGAGAYASNTLYTILATTGGVSGTFAAVTSNLAFLTPTLSYDATDVFLTVLPTTPTGAGTPDYRTAASTPNQFAVASGLTTAGVANGGTGPVLAALNQLTAAQARGAFDSLSGEGISASQQVAHRSAALFTSTIFDQTTFYGQGGTVDATTNSITLTAPSTHELADLPSAAHQPAMPVAPTRTWRAWATGFGGVATIHGSTPVGSATQNDTIYGGTLGVDYQLTSNYLVGVALGGSDGTFAVPNRATTGSTIGGHVAFYDLATFGRFYGASSTSFSYYTNKTTRSVSGFGGLGGETERGSFDSHEVRGRLEFGRHIDGFGGTVTPFVALELAELRSNGFGETAQSGPGLFALNVSGQSTASVPAFLGVQVQRVVSLGDGIVLTPSLQVAYVHEFAPERMQLGTLSSLPGSTFLVDGTRPDRNAAQIKLGGELTLGAHAALFGNFDGEISGVDQVYAGKGGLKVVW